MEAFQTLTTFFVHDLKNLASRLSLAMQNLPAHFDKPAFREDLLATMAKSVSKIDTMTSRLTTISKGMEVNPVACDLNQARGSDARKLERVDEGLTLSTHSATSRLSTRIRNRSKRY